MILLLCRILNVYQIQRLSFWFKKRIQHKSTENLHFTVWPAGMATVRCKKIENERCWNGKEPYICVSTNLLCWAILKFKLLVKRSSHKSIYGSSSCKTKSSGWCWSWNQTLSFSMSRYRKKQWITQWLHLTWKQCITSHHESHESKNSIWIQRILTFVWSSTLRKLPQNNPCPYSHLLVYSISKQISSSCLQLQLFLYNTQNPMRQGPVLLDAVHNA